MGKELPGRLRLFGRLIVAPMLHQCPTAGASEPGAVVPALDAHQLHFWRGAQHVIRGFSLTARRGETIGLLGLNGAGKSTTLQLLCGILIADSGRVRIGHLDLDSQGLDAKRMIGYLPQTTPALADETVSDFLNYQLRLQRAPRNKRRSQLRRVVERCELGEIADKRLRTLSRGLLQRVGIASACIHEPELLLLDEPSAGLDPAQRASLLELIRSLRGEVTVVLSTHLIAEVEQICDRVCIIHDGSCAADFALEQFADTNCAALELGLSAPPSIEQLQARCQARSAKALARSLFRLELSPASPKPEQIAAIAAAEGWRLFRICRPRAAAQTTLESTFLSITQRLPDTAQC